MEHKSHLTSFITLFSFLTLIASDLIMQEIGDKSYQKNRKYFILF